MQSQRWVLLLAVVLIGGSATSCKSSAQRSKAKLEELCGTEAAEALDQVQALIGQGDAADKAHECAASASSCLEAMGCYAAVGSREFERGFERGQGKEPQLPRALRPPPKAMGIFQAMVDRVCACRDMRCVEAVQTEMAAKAKEMQPRDADEAAHMASEMQPLTEKMAKCLEDVARRGSGAVN